jgi:hypothetical protein
MTTTFRYRCQFIEVASGAYVCLRCDPEGRRPVPEPGRRVCRAPVKALATELEELIRAHRPDCRGRKVSRDIFRERSEQCDPCGLRQQVRCHEADLELVAILPYIHHECPAGKWAAVAVSRAAEPKGAADGNPRPT